MRTMTYKTHGTCSSSISLVIDDNNIVEKAEFTGGCSGNTQGISKLVKGMNAEKVIELLKGTRCGSKNTSCPDQLAHALEEALAK